MHLNRSRLLTAALACALLAGSSAGSERVEATEPNIPNLLFVLTDDQRLDSMSVMPATTENFNVEFSTAIVTQSNCCPSRASILTGEYPSNTGVTDNSFKSYTRFRSRQMESLGPWLQAQGYYTGFIGKYFNAFDSTLESAPPGWDEFYGFDGRGTSGSDKGSYNSFALRERRPDGSGFSEETVIYNGVYSTSVFSDLADDYIRRAEDPGTNPTGKPWALFLWTKAPHSPYTPEAAYAEAAVPEWMPAPSFQEADMSDKPPEVKNAPILLDPTRAQVVRDGMLRTLMSVDDMIERLFGTLDQLDVRSSTWGLYLSDNGHFLGEHRLGGKYYGYEESIRIPFRMAVPGVAATVIDPIVSNVDVAPTLLDLAADASSHPFDGRSVLPLVEGDMQDWRRGEVFFGFPGDKGPDWFRFVGVRTPRFKYIRWKSGNEEFYDLKNDPYELNNLVRRRARLVNQFRRRATSF